MDISEIINNSEKKLSKIYETIAKIPKSLYKLGILFNFLIKLFFEEIFVITIKDKAIIYKSTQTNNAFGFLINTS